MIIDFIIDGNQTELDINPMTLLVNALKKRFDIVSAHYSCTSGECGDCAVLVNNQLQLSCLLPVFAIKGKEVVTYEGFKKTKDYADIVRAFSFAGYQPCEYCMPSKILSIHALLETNLSPGKQEILDSLSGSSCFCSGYSALIKAVNYAAANRKRKRRVRKR